MLFKSIEMITKGMHLILKKRKEIKHTFFTIMIKTKKKRKDKKVRVKSQRKNKEEKMREGGRKGRRERLFCGRGCATMSIL
jgi:hypothetical protein